MPTGRVKWYDKSKGYGFIESPEGDVFFHFSDIVMEGFKALAEDQRVSYTLLRSDQGLKAKEIHPMDSRATVRHAARYRTLLLMELLPGQEDRFDEKMANLPGWLDALQQDLGLRSIGTWRHELHAVHVVESDKPYEQLMDVARKSPKWEKMQAWQDELRELLAKDHVPMTPVTSETCYVSDEKKIARDKTRQ